MGQGSSKRSSGGRKVESLARKFVLLGFRSEGTWDTPGILPGCAGPTGVFKNFVLIFQPHRIGGAGNMNVGANRLSGTLPDVVGFLFECTYFDFRENDLAGTLPGA